MSVGIVLSVAVSVLSSSGIVLLNKQLFSRDAFKFPATLTGWHLLTTCAVLLVARRFRLFEQKKLAGRYVVGFCVFDAAAMALQNLSLAHNSINFYQTCKLFTIPTTVLLEKMLGKPLPSLLKLFALSIITVGVALCMRINLQANFLGLAVGVGATLSTALVLVSTAWLQESQKISSTQLLQNVAGVDGILLSALGPVLDFHLSYSNVYKDYKWTVRGALLVASTCAFAVIVNAVTFYLLGKISAVSYQVIGQMKTVLVYGAGYVLFDKASDTSMSLPGTCMVITGGFVYSWASMRNEMKL